MLVLAHASSKGTAKIWSPCGSILTAEATSCLEGRPRAVSSVEREGANPDSLSAASLGPLLMVQHMAAPCPLKIKSMVDELGRDLQNPRAHWGEAEAETEIALLGKMNTLSRGTDGTSKRHLMQGALGPPIIQLSV